jgi:hypothetical protein
VKAKKKKAKKTVKKGDKPATVKAG